MTDVNLRGRLGDRLATGTLPGWSQLDRVGEQVTQGAFSMIGAGDASIEITVEMSDGSTVVYKLSVESGTGQYLEGRSRTKDGQVIPDGNAPEYQGTWTGDEDIGDLKEYLEGLGAKFAQIGTGTIMESMTCTWVPPTLNCIVKVTRL